MVGTWLASRTLLPDPPAYVVLGKYCGCAMVLRHKDTPLPAFVPEGQGCLAGDSMGGSITHVPAILAAAAAIFASRTGKALVDANRQR